MTFNKSLFGYLLIILAACVVYAKIFSFQLVYLDDNVWIQDYGWLFQDLKNANRLLTQPDFISNVFWRPLLNFSFFVDAQWKGNSLVSYRVTNLLIHLVNGCLVFSLFNLMGFARRIALSLALIFTVHPVLTAAIAWIPGRTDSLFGMMSLASIIFYIRAVKTNQWKEKAAHYLFFILALLSKETAVAIPAVCILYSLLIVKDRVHVIRPMVMWIVIVGVFMAIRGKIIPHDNHVELTEALRSFVANSPSFISYLGKIFLPVNLSVLPNLEDITLVWGSISFVGLIMAVIFSKQKPWSMIIFGLAWFLLFLAPSLVISFLTHEYRLYIPILGILMIVGSLDYIQRLSENKKVWWVLTAVIVGTLSITTFIFSENFRGRVVFWDNAVKNSPHLALAHRNRGAMYHLEGKLDEAEKSYEEALKLNTNEFMANNNLGLIAASRGDFAQAESFYLREIQINPTYDNVYLNLGILYYQAGKNDGAIMMWKKAIELNPNFMDAYKNLMICYYQNKDYQSMAPYAQWLKEHGVVLPPQILSVINGV